MHWTSCHQNILCISMHFHYDVAAAAIGSFVYIFIRIGVFGFMNLSRVNDIKYISMQYACVFFLLHPIHINEIVAWMSSIRNGPCSPPLNWKANVRAARGKSAHGRRAKRKETSTARVAENLWDRQFLSSDCRLPFNFCLFEYMILRSQYNATALYIHICWIFEWCSPCVTHGDTVASWCATNTARALLRAQR